MMKRVTMNLLPKNLFSTIYCPFVRPLFIHMASRMPYSNLRTRNRAAGGGSINNLQGNHLPGRGGFTNYRGSTPVWKDGLEQPPSPNFLRFSLGNFCKEHVMTIRLRPFQFSKDWTWGGKGEKDSKDWTGHKKALVKIEHIFSHFSSISKNWTNWRGRKKTSQAYENYKIRINWVWMTLTVTFNKELTWKYF